jgi:hypothetical protein
MVSSDQGCEKADLELQSFCLLELHPEAFHLAEFVLLLLQLLRQKASPGDGNMMVYCDVASRRLVVFDILRI